MNCQPTADTQSGSFFTAECGTYSSWFSDFMGNPLPTSGTDFIIYIDNTNAGYGVLESGSCPSKSDYFAEFPVTWDGVNESSLSFGAPIYINDCVNGTIYPSSTSEITNGITTQSSGIPPIPPTTVSFNSPTQGSVVSDFPSWNLQSQVSTSTDYYAVAVFYQEQGQIGSFYDDFNFPGFSATSSVNDYIQKSQTLAQLNATSTWNATAYLIDTSMPNTDNVLPIAGTIVATSSAIQFGVSPVTSANSSSSSSYPLFTVPSDTIANYQVATSTCSSWLDITCELGNWSSNVFNYLFAINQTDIDRIAGFNLATQAPWSYLFEIQQDFANTNSLASTASSTASISLTFGNQSTPMVFFSQSIAEQFMGPSVITFIRSILLAFLYLLFIFGAYVEIKEIFKIET
jgi:hypothetical protein